MPTYIVTFDPKDDILAEIDNLYNWAVNKAFPKGPFVLDLHPTENERMMVAFKKAHDIELFLYGLKIGWSLHHKLWQEMLH
jgi:hypothetical protein